MRRKWRRCRCSPTLSPHADFACCRCILLMPTQEWIQSPLSSYSLPSDLVESPRSGLVLHGQFTEAQIEELTAIVKKLEEQERRYCENEPRSHGTEIIMNDATRVLISSGHGKSKTANRRRNGRHCVLRQCTCCSVCSDILYQSSYNLRFTGRTYTTGFTNFYA
ncbi:hypothetical protein KC19_VG293400 [Ceratodon purpureus]|uniref:Uncharacterized protein n=1 Tax=Ceratodon purpureus TaxID=3225 RepID=A0A8T0HVS3_CERPU|nr:hypothetical protein KC19_VG293400 [Ceratodon purpureus]